MSIPPQHLVTQLLQEWKHGDQSALEKLIPLVYEELRRQAAHYMRREATAKRNRRGYGATIDK